MRFDQRVATHPSCWRFVVPSSVGGALYMWYRLFSVVLLWPLAVAAQQHALTLEQAIDLAMREAPQVAASSAMLEGAQAIAPSAGRLPDPELATGVDNLPIDTTDRFSFTRDFMTMRTVGLMQSFPSGTKRRLRSERAERDIAVAQGGLRKTRFDVSRATAEAWIATAVTDESLVQLQRLRPDAQLQASAARGALSSGQSTAAEALTAQSLLAALDERILALQQDAEMQCAELARWIGADADRPLAPIPTERELEHSTDSLVAAVADHAPLAPAVARLDAAKTDVALARAEKRPDWSAELTYARRGPDFSNMVSLEFRIGLPLFPKHRQDPLIAEKLATVRAQEAERDAEVRMHTAEIRAAISQWRLGRERLNHYAQELLPLAHDRSRAALASYGSGSGDLRSVTDALTEEINTQLESIQLQGAVARAWVFLHLLHDSGTQP
jgi:outer membrane protein, heavy metal efflux system